MNLREIEDYIRMELRRKILPEIQNCLQSSSVDFKLFYLEAQTNGRENFDKFEAKELLTRKSFDSKIPALRIVAGQVGCGRTTLAHSLMKSWLIHDESSFPGISKFKLCLLLHGNKLEKDDLRHVLNTWLPYSINHCGRDMFFEWLKSSKVLLIVDDFFIEAAQLKNLHELIEEWNESEAIIITNLNDTGRLEKLVGERPFFYCQFQKLTDFPNIIKQCGGGGWVDIYQMKLSFEDIPVLFDNFGSIKYYCEAIKDEIIQTTPCTMSDVVWDTTYKKISNVLQSRPYLRTKIEEWFLNLCQTSYECFAKRTLLFGNEVNALIEATINLFPSLTDTAILLLTVLSYQTSFFENTNSISWSVRHEPQQEVFTALYILYRCMDGMPMKRLLKKIEGEDRFAIYAAGLLRKVLTEEHTFFRMFEENDSQKRQKKIIRVIKNLGLQTDRSSDPVSFIFRVVHEMRCHPLLTKMFLHECYIPPHLHLRDDAIYKDAIEAVLEHCQSKKVYLLIRKEHHAPDLHATLNYLKSLTLKISVALMNHLNWKSSIRSNAYIEILSQAGCSLRLVDFIGCLDKHIISKLDQWEATKHLVCLRVRVCDGDTAKSLVSCQDKLKSLMWLEIDFDFSLSEVLELTLPQIRTPLIDLSFSHAEDSYIPKICDFLYSISRTYSGIHIHASSVSPQGVIEILKYFYRRSMRMNADSKAVLKYRKYRFPEFSSVGPREGIDDEKAKSLLGYDDRQHYSDNEVHSSHYSANEDINRLNMFLGVMTDLRYFKYSCMNYTVTKDSDGTCLITKIKF